MEKIGASIELQNLVKNFGKIKAVDNISCHIEPGEFMTILGPSGSGKTTTLNLIAGFEVPSSGRILVGGQDIAYKPPHKRNLGMVFQNYALFPHMPVFDNIAFPLRNRGYSKTEVKKKVYEVLALVQLSGYETRFPKQLSGGQQQRISLARSLAYSPQALLMDEPLGALDKKLREHMQQEIKKIQKETGITVVYVTHDQEEALNMSDRIAVMNLGHIEQIDNPLTIYERPNNWFIADFVGEANLFEGKVLRVERGEAMVRLWSDTSVRALNPHGKLDGQSVGVMIRPERVRFKENDCALDNCFVGTVEDRSYVGQLLRYTISVGDGNNVSMRIHSRGQGIEPVGRKIEFGWNCEDALVV